MDDFESGATHRLAGGRRRLGGLVRVHRRPQGTRSRAERPERPVRSPRSAAGRVRGGDRHERSRDAASCTGTCGWRVASPCSVTVFYAGAGPVQQPGDPGLSTRPRRTSSSGSTSSIPRHPSTRWRAAMCWSTSSTPRRAIRPAASRPRCASTCRPGRARRSASASPRPITQGPLRVGVDNIRFQPVGTDADGPGRAAGHRRGRRAPSISSCTG